MAKGPPRHNFLAEPLYTQHQPLNRYIKENVEAYTSDLIKVARRVHPQHLDGNVPTFVFAPPHISEPTAIQRGARPIVARRNPQRPREQRMTTADPV